MRRGSRCLRHPQTRRRRNLPARQDPARANRTDARENDPVDIPGDGDGDVNGSDRQRQRPRLPQRQRTPVRRPAGDANSLASSLGHMHATHRASHARMTQQHLHGTQVNSIFEQVSCERVTHQMRIDAKIEPRIASRMGHRLGNSVPRQRSLCPVARKHVRPPGGNSHSISAALRPSGGSKAYRVHETSLPCARE
jgi:hypothetical protein